MLINKSNLSRRRFLIMSGVSLGVLTLSACVSPTPATETSAIPQSETITAPEAPSTEPRRGGTLRMAVSENPTSLNPSINLNITDTILGFSLYNRLTRLNEGATDKSITPELAESWEVSEDGLSHTFHLRQDVLFQHGTPLTAKDVVYTLERIRNPDIASSAELPPITTIEAVNDYTVRIDLEAPNVTLPFLLGVPGTEIIPHDRTTEQLEQEPSGTGAFRLQEYTPGEQLVFSRNEAYWQSDYPYVDQLHLLTIPERATQITALISGNVDWLPGVGVEDLPTLQTQAGIQIHASEQGRYPVFIMSVAEKPFDDLRVRQAFKHAIDRKALKQVILGEYGTIHNDQPIAPGTPFVADLPPLAYDPERAKELLAEAGYPEGLEVTLSVAEILPRIVDTAVVLQEMMKAANITLTIDKVTIDTYWAEKYDQTSFFVDYWPTFSEPDLPLSLAYLTEAPFEVSNLSDPHLDELIIQARGTPGMAERQTLYTEAQELISQEGAVIIPYISSLLMATQTKVQGLVALSTHIRPQEVWLAAEA